jgi:hypothetical protein
MSPPDYKHPAQARAESAREAVNEDLHRLIRLAVTREVGDDWTGDVDPQVVAYLEEGLVAVLRQLLENAEKAEEITASQIAAGDVIDLDAGDGAGRGYEPREVEAVSQPDAAPWHRVAGDEFSPRVRVTFTDSQPAAQFRLADKLWRITVGEPKEEPAPIWLSPQAQAVVAGMLDPEVRKKEQETGESYVHAPDEAWAEVEKAFPADIYRNRVNEEGEIS